MKKSVLSILVIISLFLIFISGCANECDDDSECKEWEYCKNGDCKSKRQCEEPCHPKTCYKNTCDHSTDYKCVHTIIDGKGGYNCDGWYNKGECLVNICRSGSCVQERTKYACETTSEREERLKEIQIPCPDGTPHLECSKLKPGFYCGDNGKYEYEPSICLKCSDGTLATDCSEVTDGYYCTEEGKLIPDEDCRPEPNQKQAAALQKQPEETVEEEPEPDTEEETEQEDPFAHSTTGCSDGTEENDCSWENNGKWCIGGELVDDDFCLDSCEDGTANTICSFKTEGYRCENRDLIQDETCEPGYVEPVIDCEDGTPDGHCTSQGDGYWCNHGVLEYDESCVS